MSSTANIFSRQGARQILRSLPIAASPSATISDLTLPSANTSGGTSWLLKPFPFAQHELYTHKETCRLDPRDQRSKSMLSVSPRIAVLTFVSRDAPQLCDSFMRYYTSQGVAPSHIFIVEADASPDQSACYERAGIPAANVQRRPYPRKDYDSPQGFNGMHRVATLQEVQAALLASNRFSHALVVDLDEIVVVDRRVYENLHEYVSRNMAREVVAPVGYEVQYAPSLGEKPLDWARPPLLLQRSLLI